MNVSKEQKQRWIIKHCMSKNGCIDLKGLIFNCDVDISYMKVDGNLKQQNQKVKNGNLWQYNQEVKNGDLFQNEINKGEK